MSGSNQISPGQLNSINRSAVLGSSLEMMQSIYTQTITTPGVTANTIINVPPRNAGIIKSFYVQIGLNFSTSAGCTATRNPLGPANLVSNFTFVDLNNMQRVNTSGAHIAFLNAAKRKRAPGSAFTTDSPLGFGSNYATTVAAPATLVASTTYNTYMMYEIPISYSDDDLRGAIFASVTNATMNLQITLNNTAWFQTAGDKLFGIYTYAGGTITVNNVTVNVYQNYLDQIPYDQSGQPILPMMDLSLYYDLKSTNYSGFTVGSDFPFPFANLRNFLSTFVIYNNNATLNAGTDINYFALRSANTTNIFQLTPDIISYRTKNMLQDDMPAGCYYFDFRRRPINTQTYGNMSLYLNPSVVSAASANAWLYYEAMGQAVVVSGAGSIGGG